MLLSMKLALKLILHLHLNDEWMQTYQSVAFDKYQIDKAGENDEFTSCYN